MQCLPPATRCRYDFYESGSYESRQQWGHYAGHLASHTLAVSWTSSIVSPDPGSESLTERTSIKEPQRSLHVTRNFRSSKSTVCDARSMQNVACNSRHFRGRLQQMIHARIFFASSRSALFGLLYTLDTTRSYLIRQWKLSYLWRACNGVVGDGTDAFSSPSGKLSGSSSTFSRALVVWLWRFAKTSLA